MESNEEEFQFEIENLSSRPLMIGDIKEMFHNIDAAYKYLDTMDESARKVFQPILDIAGDCACNLCYELGFDSPDPIAFGEYYSYKLQL